jgi:hypothetical protein
MTWETVTLNGMFEFYVQFLGSVLMFWVVYKVIRQAI